MNQLVETSVFRRIRTIIDLAVDTGHNVAIIGSAGVGKTTALHAYTSDYIRVAHITMTKVISRSMRELLSIICEKVEIRTWDRESIYDMQHSLRRYHLGDWIVVIDEAQMLPLDHLKQLLDFSPTDNGSLRFVFCGNEEVLKQINLERGALTQIGRRIKLRDTIAGIEDEDSDALTNFFGADAHETMRAIGRRFHTDGIVAVLSLARRFARGEAIKQGHVLDALDVLTQYRVALETKRKRGKAD